MMPACASARLQIMPLVSRISQLKCFGFCGKQSRRAVSSHDNAESSAKPEKEGFYFSKSRNYPQKVDLMKNLYPNVVESPSVFRIWFGRIMTVALPLATIVFLLFAFTTDYDIDIEEKLIEGLPGYKDAMEQGNPKYVETIEKLRQERKAPETSAD